jgi:hypothetical protein
VTLTTTRRFAYGSSVRAIFLVSSLVLLPLVSLADSEEPEGKLFVVSFPRGIVVVDGEVTAIRTPNTGFLVPAGEHDVAVLWADGERSPAQSITVREGKTTHLYFRRHPGESAEARCDEGRDDACFALVGEALRGGDEAEVVTRAEAYLERFPDGAYAKMARSIVDAKDVILEDRTRRVRTLMIVAALVLGAVFALIAARRAKR